MVPAATIGPPLRRLPPRRRGTTRRFCLVLSPPAPGGLTSPSPPPAFALRMNGLRSAAIRDLLTITARPEIVSLAGGLPDPELIPRERIREASEAVLVRSNAVQYTETAGWF